MADGEVVGEAGWDDVREATLPAARAAGAPASEGWEERAEGSEGPAAEEDGSSQGSERAAMITRYLGSVFSVKVRPYMRSVTPSKRAARSLYVDCTYM